MQTCRLTQKIKIFTDRQYLPTAAPHCELLYPFWGLVEEKAHWKYDKRFDRYLNIGPTIFEITSNAAEADVHLLPADWGYYLPSRELAKAGEMSQIAETFGKSVMAFFRDDRECITNLPNSIEFCTNLERSTRRKNQHALVAWTGDFIATYLNGKMPIREKIGKPVVGFCGQTIWHKNFWTKGMSLLRRIRHPSNYQKFRFLRMRDNVLQSLGRSRLVRSNFVRRQGWYGGKESLVGGEHEEMVKNARLEYVSNLVNCDYVVTVRGAGNYSFRFYEALACGRIPLFIDTDCVLPFETEINWKDYCVWLDYSDFRHAGEAVADFHSGLSNRRFIELQHECRRIYEEWVSPEGFFSKLHVLLGLDRS